MSGSPAGTRVRPAEGGDAWSIADAHVRGWQHAYRGLVPDAILDGFSIEERAALWSERIAALADDPDGRIWVVEAAGTVQGFAAAGPANADAAPPPPGAGEVFAIYVAPEARGRGYGRTLFATVVADLTARAFRPIVVWVFDANDGARRFYEAAGFHADGTRHPLDFDGVMLDEIRYVLDPAGA